MLSISYYFEVVLMFIFLIKQSMLSILQEVIQQKEEKKWKEREEYKKERERERERDRDRGRRRSHSR